MQTEDKTLSEIRETNLAYLILAQSLIRSDRVQALYRLGLSEELADLLAELSPAQLLKIAQSNMVICRFRFDDSLMWSLLADHGENGPQREVRSSARLHAAILMAGNYAETLAPEASNERA